MSYIQEHLHSLFNLIESINGQSLSQSMGNQWAIQLSKLLGKLNGSYPIDHIIHSITYLFHTRLCTPNEFTHNFANGTPITTHISMLFARHRSVKLIYK